MTGAKNHRFGHVADPSRILVMTCKLLRCLLIHQKFHVFSIFGWSRMHVMRSRDVLSIVITSTMSETSSLMCAASKNEFWSQESSECDWRDHRQTGRPRIRPELYSKMNHKFYVVEHFCCEHRNYKAHLHNYFRRKFRHNFVKPKNTALVSTWLC